MKRMAIFPINHPGEGSVLGQEIRAWTSSPKAESQGIIFFSLCVQNFGLIRTLWQGAAWRSSSNRGGAIPGHRRDRPREFREHLREVLRDSSISSSSYILLKVTIWTLLNYIPPMTWMSKRCGPVPNDRNSDAAVTIRTQLCCMRQGSLESPQIIMVATTTSWNYLPDHPAPRPARDIRFT